MLSASTIFLAAALALDPAHDVVATVELASPQANLDVPAGGTVSWSVQVLLTDSRTAGLAGVCADLVQDIANPAPIILQPGSVPALMTGFSRPAGFSNHIQGGSSSAYGGTPIEIGAAVNLIQVGGSQNTFGVAGASVGTDAIVDTGISMGTPASIVAGTFTAPSTTGSYCLGLHNIKVNVLAQAPSGSGAWPVMYAFVDASLPVSFCFTVVPACDPDYTQDGNVDQADIACLIALVGGDPTCSPLDPDFNQDGNADQADVAVLIDVVGGAPCP